MAAAPQAPAPTTTTSASIGRSEAVRPDAALSVAAPCVAVRSAVAEGPDAPRVDLATLALSTSAACDAKRSAQVDSDEEDWNRGGWEGLG